MKIFFIGGRKDQKHYQVSLDVLKKIEAYGHQVDKSQMESTYKHDEEHIEDTYKRDYSSIKKSDVVIVESSETSSGIGFLIATALNEKKPVLVLNNSNINKKPSITLKSAKNKLFTFSEYTPQTIDVILKSFFVKIKALLDTKFILIISPEIDKYLQWASNFKRMHKAQLVRNAVEEMMERDREFKSFLVKGE
ncbi:MAG TPA: hypothetical protein VJC17_04095 [Candidatus Dojkabacteria bacterium]|nr:hypothetical protein [Candidatus Dojkabacteria bacterium]